MIKVNMETDIMIFFASSFYVRFPPQIHSLPKNLFFILHFLFKFKIGVQLKLLLRGDTYLKSSHYIG